MTRAEIKSNAFDLYRSSEVIVVAKRRENVVDGIVTGIIANALSLPVLLLMLLVGLWLLVVTVTQAHRLLPGLMGIMFVGVSILLLRLFLKSEFCFFPYECRFKKAMDGRWFVQQRLWFVSFPWRRLGHGWSIFCRPAYSGGDWGYTFFIRNEKTVLLLASSGVFADSKSRVDAEARSDLARLCSLFGVSGELKQWT
jgi:hypothetical protein